MLVVSIALSALFLWLASRGVDFSLFWESLQECNYLLLLPALVTLVVGVLIRSLRWQLLFAPATRPPFGPVTRALLVGQLFNVVLPMRAGEAARIVVLYQDVRTSRAESLGTVAVERLYDVLGLLLLLLVATPFLPEVTWIRRAGFFAAVLLVLAVIGAVVVGRYGARPVRVVLRPLTRLPRVTRTHVDGIADRLVYGLQALHRPSLAAPGFLLGVASWLVFALSCWFVLEAFDLGLGYGAGILMLVTTTLSLVIPSAPAGVGVFEAGGVLALSAFGVDDSTALSATVVLHALTVFPVVVAGAFALHGHALRLRSARQVS